MKRIRYSLAIVLTILFSCDSSLEETKVQSGFEQLIAGNWQFHSLYVNGEELTHVGHAFEPSSRNWENRWIAWLWFEYNLDNTYEYRSDRRRTPLGSGVNYQPEIGYWMLDEKDSLLIHNVGTYYETKYKILQINDSNFTREYERIILDSNDTTKWKIGDLAIYREVFKPRIGP